MKKTITLSLVALLYSAIIYAQAEKKPIQKIKITELRTIMDTTSAPLIVNFWASWCAPCIHEIPWFEKINDSLGSPAKIILVSLDFPEDYPAGLQKFVNKKGYTSEVLFLNETNADYFIPLIDPKWTGAIPASVFINNSKKYYQLFNQQLPEARFLLELKKLVE